MSHQNSSVLNLRKCYRSVNEATGINGYRNTIFLPGIGRYKGMWNKNLREGLGTLTTNNDVVYEGNWVNDERHGHGSLQVKHNSRRICYASIYDGDWRFGRRHGEGTAYYEDGFYEGQWKNNCRDGLGIMRFFDGSYYIGEWKHDSFHGIGAHYDFTGTFYKGHFSNGKRHGEGILSCIRKGKIQKGMWMDGSCVTSILQNDYENQEVIPSIELPEIRLANPVSVITESLQSAHNNQININRK